MAATYPLTLSRNPVCVRLFSMTDGGTRDHPTPVVAIVGPTAAGKSELSLDLAEALGGEVVNTDAMQLYRGMDIGTAKLPVEERRGVPHHLLDVLDVTEPATVAEFQRWAREVIADCRARGVTPVLVGGSALYTRAILDRFEFPGTDPAVRHQLEEELAEIGPEAMHRRLTAVDADAAARIIPTNGRRIVRALEVIAITGRPFSATLPELRAIGANGRILPTDPADDEMDLPVLMVRSRVSGSGRAVDAETRSIIDFLATATRPNSVRPVSSAAVQPARAARIVSFAPAADARPSGGSVSMTMGWSRDVRASTRSSSVR